MTSSAVGARRAGPSARGQDELPAGADRPQLVTGAIAACAVTGSGLAVITLLVLAGWIAAPHAGPGLPAVLRTAASLWLVGHHVGFALRGAGRIGMLPLGLVVLPGALLWRAGRWVVITGSIRRLRHVGYAALALAVPYSLLTGALAVASKSALATASLPQALVCGLLLAVAAGGLGGARALAPWGQLVALLPERPRSVVIGVAGSLAVLAAAGAALAGVGLAVHLHASSGLENSLRPGLIGMVLLLLLQLSYVPNAVAWAMAFCLGPGFAFGTSTVVAPTGSVLAQLPAFPMLAALPAGFHAAMPGWLAAVVLALPYLAGGVGGLLLIRAAPTLSIEAAPLWGMACGLIAGCLLAVLAAFSGGPLGDAHLAAVGPSGWQVGAVAALEIGVAAAITAGLSNYLVLRRLARHAGGGRSTSVPAPRQQLDAADAGHVFYLDPWAGEPPAGPPVTPAGPSSLP